VASVISHPAVPLAVAVALGSSRVPLALTVAACAVSVLPDLDALGFRTGIPYEHLFGHRGFTHSLSFALFVAAVGTCFARSLGSSPRLTFAVLFVSIASHGVLDALTTDGLGVAFFSPFSNRRYFFPWRVLATSPIGVRSFMSRWGLRVLQSELTWVWAPCAAIAVIGVAFRRLWRAPKLYNAFSRQEE
jgi:inner membrane protein